MEDPAGRSHWQRQQRGLGFQADPDSGTVPSLSRDLTLTHSDLPKASIFSFIKRRDNRAPFSFRVTVRIKYESTYSMNEGR